MSKPTYECSINELVRLKEAGMGSRKIAEALGVCKSTVNYWYERYQSFRISVPKEVKKDKKGPKIFIGDVETSASIVYTFRYFKTNVGADQVVQYPYMLTWAGKWLGNPMVMSDMLPNYPEVFSYDVTNDFGVVQSLWKILDACDIFIAHNSPFDQGWFNQRCLYWGLPAPSPYQVIDTRAELKRICSLPSNSLAHSANYFELGSHKLHNDGFPLWKRCMDGDVQAFNDMLTYNIGDIYPLEELYLKIRSFMPRHPNVAVIINDIKPRCVCCGSTELDEIEGKLYHTAVSSFATYRCADCNKINRSRVNLRTKEQRAATLLNG